MGVHPMVGNEAEIFTIAILGSEKIVCKHRLYVGNSLGFTG